MLLTKKPQSAFAKALAMKKQTSLDDQQAVLSDSMAKKTSQVEQENPFDIIESVNQIHIVQELEIVTEDAFEDKHSSTTKRDTLRTQLLPMKRENFMQQYMDVLT